MMSAVMTLEDPRRRYYTLLIDPILFLAPSSTSFRTVATT